MNKEKMSAKGGSAYGGKNKKTILSTFGLAIFLGGLVFLLPIEVKADYASTASYTNCKIGFDEISWDSSGDELTDYTYPVNSSSSPQSCDFGCCVTMVNLNFDSQCVLTWSADGSGVLQYGQSATEGTKGCGDIGGFNMINRSLPDTFTCSPGDTLSADKTTCITTPPATCSGTAQVSTPSGYSCLNGESLSGTNCEYAAILSGGVKYDAPVYKDQGGPLSPNSVTCSSDNSDECWNNPIFGYASSTSFSNSLPIYKYQSGPLLPNSVTCSSDNSDDCSNNPIFGYASSTSFSNSLPIYKYQSGPLLPNSVTCSSDNSDDCSNNPIFGYVASSPGIYGGTSSCNSGDTLSADKTKCSHPATPTYACSNVCSAKFSYTQEAYISNDADCTTRADANTTFSLNANCGIKLFPAPAPLDSSSLTPCIQAADGVCGAAKDVPTASIPTTSLCGLTGGNASPVIDSGTKWDWTCIGSSTTAPCSASKSCTPTYDNYICTSMEISCDASNAGKTIISKTPVCVRNVANGCNQGVTQPSPQECIDNGALCPAQESKLCPAAREIKSWQEISAS